MLQAFLECCTYNMTTATAFLSNSYLKDSTTPDCFTHKPSVVSAAEAKVPPTAPTRATTVAAVGPARVVLARSHPGCPGDRAWKSPASASCGLA